MRAVEHDEQAPAGLECGDVPAMSRTQHGMLVDADEKGVTVVKMVLHDLNLSLVWHALIPSYGCAALACVVRYPFKRCPNQLSRKRLYSKRGS